MVYCTPVFGFSTLQEPEIHRVFDSDFKSRYSREKFNYEGKKIVNKTPSGSGKYEDYKNGNVKTRERNNSESAQINLGPFAWLFYIILAAAVLYLVYILLNAR